MKNKILPFTVSALCAALIGCGGESNTINEDPIRKPMETTLVGCTVASSSSSCFEFLMEYPVAGLQYTCSSDNVNTFITQGDGNTVKGGCNTKDTVTFFLNANDQYRIDFGKVLLSDLGFVSAQNLPVHLTILDMARGLTGKPASNLNINDETTYVALQLIKILQAVGTQKTKSHVLGDVQQINLRPTGLTDLDKITAKVDLAALKSGAYVNDIKPWVDVSQITDEMALEVLKQISNVTLGAVYQADPPILVAATEGLLGYAGTGTNSKTLLGTFLLMSDRQGYTHGYGLQWRGVPTRTGESAAVALDLLTQANPVMMRAAVQTDWIDIITKRIGTKEQFKFVTTQNETLSINQGRLLNDYGVAGSQAFYKYLSNQDTVVENDLSKWTQTVGSDQYAGGVDLVKAYPIAYLDRRVMPTERNVQEGEKYYFPLYATLTFRQTDKELKDLRLGIVIDEFGDIRTDIKKDATTEDMTGQCGVVPNPKAAKLTDNYGVEQYRIGTISATNYQPQQQDLTIVPRLILSGAQYGVLDGASVGLNTSLLGTEGTIPANNNGVKINIFNLLSAANSASSNINITNYQNGAAQWVNMYNSYKVLFVDSQDEKEYTPTDLEKQQVKAVAGTLSIQLAPCYSVKTKS